MYIAVDIRASAKGCKHKNAAIGSVKINPRLIFTVTDAYELCSLLKLYECKEHRFRKQQQEKIFELCVRFTVKGCFTRILCDEIFCRFLSLFR